MQAHHVGVDTVEPFGDAVDLGDARQEHQHVAVVLRQRGVDGPGDARLDAFAAIGWPVHDVDGVQGCVRRDDGSVTEEVGEPVGGHGRRRGEQPEVVAQSGACVEQQREQEVGVEVAFVAFVEHDHRGVVQLGVVLQAPH